MKYVKGYQVKQVGPFCAKEWFEGLTEEVIECRDEYLVCGIPIPREQITELVDVTAKRATLDLSPPKQKRHNVDELLKRFDQDAMLLDVSVMYACSKAEGVRVLPDICREELKQQVAFQRALIATAICDAERQDAYDRMRSLYLTTLKEIKAAPTIKSVLRQKRK